MTARGTGRAQPRLDTALEIAGEGVVLSSLRRRGGWLELRLACESPQPSAAVVSGALREAREADLLGRPGASLPVEGGRLALELEAWEIRTVQLRL
jgi:alpha-mannosidase